MKSVHKFFCLNPWRPLIKKCNLPAHDFNGAALLACVSLLVQLELSVFY